MIQKKALSSRAPDGAPRAHWLSAASSPVNPRATDSPPSPATHTLKDHVGGGVPSAPPKNQAARAVLHAEHPVEGLEGLMLAALQLGTSATSPPRTSEETHRQLVANTPGETFAPHASANPGDKSQYQRPHWLVSLQHPSKPPSQLHVLEGRCKNQQRAARCS